MGFRVSAGTFEDGPDLVRLLPRLASFPRPDHRTEKEIYAYDARVLDQWIDGGAPELRVFVARDEDDRLLGFALVTMKPDLLSGAPSSHLETLVVAEGSEGQGVGSALMRKAEEAAVSEGARSITLHVFDANDRARALYERQGYQAEWLRYIKLLD